MIRNFKKILY